MNERLSIGSRLAMGGDQRVVVEYLAAGGDVNALEYSRSVLFFAALGGGSGAVKMLLDHGADARWIDPITSMTALHAVVRGRDFAAAKALIDAGADVDAADQAGNTPLMIALNPHPPCEFAVIQLLLDHGASLDRANNYGVTARAMAARQPEFALLLDRRDGDQGL